MPCRTDDYPSSSDECERERKRQEDEFTHNSRLAEIFCATMQALEKSGKGALFKSNDDQDSLPRCIPNIARTWWRAHKARDKGRLDAELAAIKLKQDKEAALAKLSTYERELLGIK